MLDAIPRRLPAETLWQYLQRLNAIDPTALDRPARHCLARRITETEKVLGKAVERARRKRNAEAAKRKGKKGG
jgi:hypothetical protein